MVAFLAFVFAFLPLIWRIIRALLAIAVLLAFLALMAIIIKEGLPPWPWLVLILAFFLVIGLCVDFMDRQKTATRALPTQMPDGRSRCFRGAKIDIAGTEQHVYAAHMVEQESA